MKKNNSRRLRIAATTVILTVLFVSTALAYTGVSASAFSGIAPGLSSVISAWLSPPAPAPASEAVVVTDKGDYVPGETVNITGSGFSPNQLVTLQVVHIAPQGLKEGVREAEFADHQGHDPWTVMVGDDGNFISSWLVQEDSLGQTLLLTADQPGVHAEAVFTDASVGEYNQCSNDDGDGYATGDTGCRWTNGNIQQNNSTIFEGDATVQRLWLDGLTAGSQHTVTLKYGTTKGGKHTYDYLTTFNFSETWVTDADKCQDFDANGNGAGGGCTLWGADDTFDIPVDPNPAFANGGPGGIAVPQPSAPGARVFTMRNGNITAATVPVVVSGTYAADSETVITITFTVGNDSDACPTAGNCSIALWFGAHVALTTQWASGGATSVPGSPYHVALDQLDGASIGQRDNQMQANAIVPPTGVLTISKETLGGVGGPFNFTASPATAPIPANFALTTTAPINPASISWSDVPEGVYRITESSLPAGWSFFNITCSGDTDGGNTINLAGRFVDIDLDDAEGQNCTFRNVKPEARIVLSPLTATNEVGQNHTITATVTQDDHIPIGGTGGDAFDGFGPAPADTLVTFSLLNNNSGSLFVGGDNDCTTVGATGQCSVQITGPNAGGVDIHATTTFTVHGVSLTRATGDSLSGDSVDAHKDFVNMSIAITPDLDTNGVGDPHVFTVTVTKFPAGVPAAGGTVAITTNLNPAPGVSTPNTCGPAVAFVANVATCQVTINNNTAGTFTLNASATATLGNPGIVVTRDTDSATPLIGSGPGGTGPGVKNYVDMSVSIAASATNPVGQPHQFTVTVTKLPSTASGANVNVTTSVNPAPTLGATTCNVPLVFNGAGVATCTFSINSNVAGVFTANASASATIGGVALVRDTDPSTPATSGPGGSGPATKTYVAAGLTIVKKVVNDNGGTATANSFGITSTAGTVVFPNPPVESPAQTFTYTATSFSNLAPNTYTLHENNIGGYTEGSWSCQGGAGAVDSNFNTGSVALLANENVVCTIINNDDEPVLRLNKILIKDNGGTAAESDWTLFANGPTSFSGAGAAGSPDVNSPASFDAGSYALSESAGPAGYTASAFTCVFTVGGGGVPVVAGSVAVALGQDITCSITNNDNEPVLRLNKILIKDNGGTAAESDWTLFANGPTSFSGAGAAGSPDVNSPASFDAGSYALSESAGPTGYTASAFTCVFTVGGGGVPVVAGSVAVALGQDITCSITNNDNEPVLRLNKILIKDNGGTAAESDWTLFANGPTSFSGAGAAGSPDVNSPASFDAGSYALSESAGPAGYTASAFTCVFTVGGGGVPVVAGSVAVALGQDITCSITNNDNEPVLRLNKILIKDNGGTAAESDWTLFANGPTSFSGAGAAGSPDVNSPASFDAGSYALSESAGPAGYTASAFTCVFTVGGGGVPVVAGSVAVALGEDITCSITNDDQPAQLTLFKRIINDNGGTAGVGAFALSTTAGGLVFDTGNPDGNATKFLAVTLTGLSAGNKTLHEGTLTGYTNGSWACINSDLSPHPVVSSNFDTGSVLLGLGENVICGITNDDIAPTLRVIKLLVPTDDPGLFNLQIDGSTAGTGANRGHNGTTGFVPVSANVQHTVGETAGTATSLSDYGPPVFGGDCNTSGQITLALAQNATCTITNRRLPTLKIRKVINGTSQLFEFVVDGAADDPADATLSPPDDGEASTTAQNITVGDHNVQEVRVPAGWMLSDGSCVSDQPTDFITSNGGLPVLTFTARYGDDVTCTFINNQQGGATRTQGFWSTHTILANTIWNGGTLPAPNQGFNFTPVIGSADQFLCKTPIVVPPLGVPITAIVGSRTNQLMGGFWSNIANQSDKRKRNALDKVRMQFLQQYFAAVLNVHAFGTSIPNTSLATARAAYCGNNQNAIQTQHGFLAAYNESGDNVEFTPGANATPNESRRQADIPFWDTTFR